MLKTESIDGNYSGPIRSDCGRLVVKIFEHLFKIANDILVQWFGKLQMFLVMCTTKPFTTYEHSLCSDGLVIRISALTQTIISQTNVVNRGWS